MRRMTLEQTAAEQNRRRPSDLVRLVCAVVLLTVLVGQATHLVGTTEINVFRLFSSLPTGLAPLFRVLEGVGTLWTVGLVAAAAIFGRRWRLARDLILSGLVAWGVSRVLGTDVVGQVGIHASLRTLTHTGVTPNFPLVRLAVVVAVIATAGPYVSRPTRRLGQVLIVSLIVAGMYLGTAYPIDLLGGLAVGWATAAAIHLIFGSPGGRPSNSQLQEALSQTGIEVTSVRLAADQESDGTIFECEDHTGRLQVKVIGRDELDAQLFAKTWRFVAYKEPPPPLQLSRVQQVEHEACMTLLADSGAVRVPGVVFVGRAGRGAALLVLRPLDGPLLRDLDPRAVTDTLLVEVWEEVAKLHAAGISHGALDGAHVVISSRGPGIASFAAATTAGSTVRRAKNIAELLASTAPLVGDDRAVVACGKVLGEAGLRSALPFLQAAALHRPTRSALRHRQLGHRLPGDGHPGEGHPGDGQRNVHQQLDGLRHAAAERLGIEPPALPQLQRLRPTSVLLAASSLLAVALLLDQVGNPTKVWASTQNAQWGWIATALVVSLATNIPYAVALMGTVPIRLPLWPTTELQLAMSYSNLVIPLLGGTGFQIRFLQREGADLPAAVAAGGLLSIAGTVVTQVPMFALAVWVSPDALHLGGVSINGILRTTALVVVVLGIVAALAFGVPRLRRAVVPPLKQGVATIWTALRTPRQLSLIVGGNLVVSLLYGFCLLACAQAFGATMSFWTALAISIGVGTIASLIPVPGGSAAAGAIGLSGILVGLRIPTDAAVAAALADQLVVTYLPAIPGWFATKHLLQSDYL
jgi:uncharacterized membrane protein YbhN (UPF0104 family)/tRNA A-37 threonylcarbamoyl transferase component Bud32